METIVLRQIYATPYPKPKPADDTPAPKQDDGSVEFILDILREAGFEVEVSKDDDSLH